MELDLPLLRRRLVDRAPFTMSTGFPIPGMCAFILFDWEAREIVQRLERLAVVEPAIDEALNALDADMPLVAATTLLGATGR